MNRLILSAVAWEHCDPVAGTNISSFKFWNQVSEIQSGNLHLPKEQWKNLIRCHACDQRWSDRFLFSWHLLPRKRKFKSVLFTNLYKLNQEPSCWLNSESISWLSLSLRITTLHPYFLKTCPEVSPAFTHNSTFTSTWYCSARLCLGAFISLLQSGLLTFSLLIFSIYKRPMW